MIRRCTTCNREVTHGEYVLFKCPSCGEVEIVRCNTCRLVGNKYVCDKCGFEGP